MSIIGIRPKQIKDEQVYHDKDQGRIQAGHENDMSIDPHPTIEQQIQADAIYLDSFKKNIYDLESKSIG